MCEFDVKWCGVKYYTYCSEFGPELLLSDIIAPFTCFYELLLIKIVTLFKLLSTVYAGVGIRLTRTRPGSKGGGSILIQWLRAP